MDKLKKEQFAELLHGREYGSEMTMEEFHLARANDLLVCFGVGDDLLEFNGITYDELCMDHGGIAFIVKKKNGVLEVMDKEYFNEIMEHHGIDFHIPKCEIIAEWSPKELKCSWLIKSDLPHATFDIMEDGELYCRGIVIEKSDIIKALSQNM